jgi:hypothetical protein
VLLVVVLFLGAAGIVTMLRISKATEDNNKELQDIASDISSMEIELDRLSGTVDDILEQGCNGSGTTTYDPDDPYDPYPYGVEKPVIYMYADSEPVNAHVELKLTDADMAVTWPPAAENNKCYSWDVCVDRDGRIYDADGNEYAYLFWEADAYGEHSFNEGFCVSGGDTAEFLRTSLTAMGLNSRESNEFIAYWLPRMQENAYNIIRFEGLDPSDAYNKDFALSVCDTQGTSAASMLRVMMVWKASDTPLSIQPQEFHCFERKGLTVVEWGGSELTD